jgi:ABC-type bacteriocin/lantibiotic exporter with double-glycine peptidase domain
MSTMSDSTFATSSGLAALTMLVRLQDPEADQDQLRSQFGSGNVRLPEMIRAARLLGFDANVSHPTWQAMAEAALPGIAALRTGEFLIVAKIADERILVSIPRRPRRRCCPARNSRRSGTAGCF